MFNKTHTIKSEFATDEIIKILKDKVENFHRDNSVYDFEGRVNSNGEFLIQPTFDFGPRNQFRPDIIGKIHGSTIDLKFAISTFLKRLFLVIVLLEILFIAFIYYKFQNLKVLMFFPFLLVFILILNFTFESKVKKSIALLESYFK